MVVPREMTYNNDINTLDNTKPILEIMTCARSLCATTTYHERILLVPANVEPNTKINLQISPRELIPGIVTHLNPHHF